MKVFSKLNRKNLVGCLRKLVMICCIAWSVGTLFVGQIYMMVPSDFRTIPWVIILMWVGWLALTYLLVKFVRSDE